MIKITIHDLMSKIDFDPSPLISDLIKIGDICALREINGKKARKNYERAILLVSLAKKFGCKSFLEFGTGRGYAVGSLAYFCNEQMSDLFTIDRNSLDDVKSKFKSLNIPQEKIHFIECDANSITDDQINKTFDLVFIDAKHNYESVKLNYNYALRKSNKNTIFVFDDYRNKFQSVKVAIDEIQIKNKFCVHTDGWYIKNDGIHDLNNADKVVDGKEYESGMVVATNLDLGL